MKGGFTLIETMIVLVIISILAAFSMPEYAKSRKMAQAISVVADFKAIELAVNSYYIDTGMYPEDSRHGVVPPELMEYLPKEFSFKDVQGLDIEYDWEIWTVRIKAGKKKPKQYETFYGLSVRTDDAVLIKYVKALFNSAYVYSDRDYYTFLFNSEVTQKKDD